MLKTVVLLNIFVEIVINYRSKIQDKIFFLYTFIHEAWDNIDQK